MSTPAISPNVVDHFASLPDEEKRSALGRMSVEAKTALLGAIKSRQPAGVPTGQTLPAPVNFSQAAAEKLKSAPSPGRSVYDQNSPEGILQQGVDVMNFGKAAGNKVGDIIKSGKAAAKKFSYMTPDEKLGTIVLSPLGVAQGLAEGIGNTATKVVRDVGKGQVIDAATDLLGGDSAAAQRARESGDYGGAAFEQFGSPIAQAAIAEGATRALTALPKVGSVLRPTEYVGLPSERAVETLGDMAQAGVRKGSELTTVASNSLPVIQQAARELGIVDQAGNVGLKTRPSVADTLKGEGSSALRNDARKSLDLAKKAEEIANRPFEAAIGQVRSQAIAPELRENIARNLESEAQHFAPRDVSYAKALQAAADDIRNVRTLGELDDLRKIANSKVGEKFGDVNGALPYSYEAQSNAIREGLYPEVSRLTGADLTEAGRRARDVRQISNGLKMNYLEKVDPAQAKRVAEGWMGYVVNGLEGSHGIASATTKAGKRLLGKQPAGEFNAGLNRVLSGQGAGATNEVVSVAPKNTKLLPGSTAPIQFVIPTGLPEEFISGAGSPIRSTEIPGTPARYVGTEQVPNPNFTPIEGPSYRQQRQQLGTTAETIPTSVRGEMSPARSRLDQTPAGTPPSAITGPETITRNVFEPGQPGNVMHMPQAGVSGDVVRGGGGTVTTSDVEAAKGALKGLGRYTNSPEFSKLPFSEQERLMRMQQTLEKQISDYTSAPQRLPQQVKVTPAKPGMVQKSRTVRRRGVAAALMMLEAQHDTQGAQNPQPIDEQ